jgi:hypothetical protein
MKPTQVNEIISIVKKYMRYVKYGDAIVPEIRKEDLNAVKTEIEGVLK